MASRDQHAFRRKRNELEEALFVGPAGGAPSERDVRSALEPLAKAAAAPNPSGHGGSGGAGGGIADPMARLEELAAVAAGRAGAREAYFAAHGACGVRRFETAGGRTIYLIPAETFPDHVNNVYLVVDKDRKFLVDAGSLIVQSREDFARGERVLAACYGLTGALDGIADLIVTHAHMDHYGAVGLWRQKGARIHAHELDARVVSNFEERIVVAALHLRQFLQAAGVSDEERAELDRMYVMSKNMYSSVPIDRTLTDGAVVCGSVAHHVPGHCPGQICLQVDNVLLTADHVLPRITPHQAPESITPSTGLDHYFESLEKIRRVGGVDLGLPGHEEPIPRLTQRIGEIEAFHRARLDKVRAACKGEPMNVKQITEAIFGPQKAYARILAYEEAGAHVEFLARRGLLEIANLDDFRTQLNPVVYYRG